MKYVNITLVSLSIALIVIGLIMQIVNGDELWMARFYGSGVVMLFLIWMPIFLIWRAQKTKLLDALDKNEEKETES